MGELWVSQGHVEQGSRKGEAAPTTTGRTLADAPAIKVVGVLDRDERVTRAHIEREGVDSLDELVVVVLVDRGEVEPDVDVRLLHGIRLGIRVARAHDLLELGAIRVVGRRD